MISAELYHPVIFAQRVRKRLRIKVLRSFWDTNVRKSVKTKGCPSLGSGCGRIAANRNGESAMTNSGVGQKERGIRFIVRELRWRLQLRPAEGDFLGARFQILRRQNNLTPDAALEELLAGNQRFASNQLTSVEHD